MAVTKQFLQGNKTMFGSNYKDNMIMYRHLINLKKEDTRAAPIALLDIVIANIIFTGFQHVSPRYVTFI